MRITRIIEWDMGHRLPNHESQCRHVHGHRYRAEVTVEGDIIKESGVSDEGMVIDFGDIKRIIKTFIDDELDHGYMGVRGDVVLEFIKSQPFKYIEVDFIPTAENIAKWMFDRLAPKFDGAYGKVLRLKSIKLYETPNNYVTYEK